MTQRSQTAKKAYHHGDLTGALTSAVRKLIERDGAAHFSIAEACKNAGVSTAAPYKHFRDKQDILESVADSGFRDMTDAMIKAQDQAGHDPIQRISDIGKAYVQFAAENPGTFRLMFGSSPNVKRNDRVRETGRDCFGIVISEVAQHSGLQSDDVRAEQIAILLWTFVHGAASLTIDEDYEAVQFDVDVNVMIDLATKRLLAS